MCQNLLRARTAPRRYFSKLHLGTKFVGVGVLAALVTRTFGAGITVSVVLILCAGSGVSSFVDFVARPQADRGRQQPLKVDHPPSPARAAASKVAGAAATVAVAAAASPAKAVQPLVRIRISLTRGLS